MIRQVLLGVFLGFVLIDLVFDLESINGNFDAPLSFYQHRNITIPSLRMTILLQLPLICTILSQFYYLVTKRTFMSLLSFIFTLIAMAGGNHVMGLRSLMNESNDILIKEQLIEIAWTHVIMFPVLLIAILTSYSSSSSKKESSHIKSQ